MLVVCLDHAKKAEEDAFSTTIEELPPRCTVGQLPEVLGVPADTHILVRHSSCLHVRHAMTCHARLVSQH